MVYRDLPAEYNDHQTCWDVLPYRFFQFCWACVACRLCFSLLAVRNLWSSAALVVRWLPATSLFLIIFYFVSPPSSPPIPPNLWLYLFDLTNCILWFFYFIKFINHTGWRPIRSDTNQEAEHVWLTSFPSVSLQHVVTFSRSFGALICFHTVGLRKSDL